MNSISVPLRAPSEVQEKAVAEMLKFVEVSGSISDWGLLQARTLCERVRSWSVLGIVAAEKWEAKFHLSKAAATSRSVQAFKDYLQVKEFEELVP